MKLGQWSVRLLIAAALLTPLVIMIMRGSRTHSGRQPSEQGPTKSLDQVGATTRFPIFATPSEALPPEVRNTIGNRLAAMRWMKAPKNPGLQDPGVWVVPGDGRLCIIEHQPSQAVALSCTTMHDAERRGLATAMVRESEFGIPGLRVVVGVVPDGVQQVAVYTRGTIVRTPVVGGVFDLRDHAENPPDRLSLIRGTPEA